MKKELEPDHAPEHLRHPERVLDLRPRTPRSRELGERVVEGPRGPGLELGYCG